MTQSKKGTKSSKGASNFIKVPDEKVENDNANLAEESQVKKRKFLVSGSKEVAQTRGVVYVSHIPHGFYENQMRKYFEQFGCITNIKLGRSNKTGGSRGYAFIEFKFHEVAKTAAETMNNYLFFDKLLKCELVPEEKVRPTMFRGKINPKQPPARKARAVAKQQVNKQRDERQEQKRRRKQLQGLKKTAAKLQSMGVEYSVDLPTIEKEILERKARLKATGGKTPTMQIDDSDLDITLKTPPNVRKIKSRNNSAATPRQGSAQISEVSTKKQMKKRKLAMKGEDGDGKILTPQTNPIDKKNAVSLKKSKKIPNSKERRRSEPVKNIS